MLKIYKILTLLIALLSFIIYAFSLSNKTEKTYFDTICTGLPQLLYDRCILSIEQGQELIFTKLEQ